MNLQTRARRAATTAGGGCHLRSTKRQWCSGAFEQNQATRNNKLFEDWASDAGFAPMPIYM